MSREMRLRPFGDENYRILLIDNPEGGVGIFVKVNRSIFQDYAQKSLASLKDAGYQGDHEQFAQDIALAYYAANCGESETPRTVMWADDSKKEVLKKLRDAIAHQRWGKTINQLPKIEESFDSLRTGAVSEDLIGYARGAALRGLIAATHGREDTPIVYFDRMRHYPAFSRDLLAIFDHFEITEEDMQRFDPDFHDYFFERLDAAVEVLNAKKPNAEPWESWPLSENPVWQKYQEDWDDYQTWLEKKRGSQ